MSFRLPGKILEEHDLKVRSLSGTRLGLVKFGDTSRPIILDLVPEAHVGDYVRVQVGFATEIVPEAEALREYATLRESGHMQDIERDLESEEALPETVRRQKSNR
jgi:hydrogenase expression/formation protein HypC